MMKNERRIRRRDEEEKSRGKIEEETWKRRKSDALSVLSWGGFSIIRVEPPGSSPFPVVFPVFCAIDNKDSDAPSSSFGMVSSLTYGPVFLFIVIVLSFSPLIRSSVSLSLSHTSVLVVGRPL